MSGLARAQAAFDQRSATELSEDLGATLERMIQTKMTSYPSDWSEEDRREVAVKHLGWAW
jgi:hypothetical protein